MIPARLRTPRTVVPVALICLLSLLAASIVSANSLDTAPGSFSSHYAPNPIAMGPPAASSEAGTVLRRLVYHQLTSFTSRRACTPAATAPPF